METSSYFQLTCGVCGKEVRVLSTLCSQVATCPKCGVVLDIQWGDGPYTPTPDTKVIEAELEPTEETPNANT